ncbi:hypothetical protein V8D89_004773 [Ganoderma adspersum]
MFRPASRISRSFQLQLPAKPTLSPPGTQRSESTHVINAPGRPLAVGFAPRLQSATPGSQALSKVQSTRVVAALIVAPAPYAPPLSLPNTPKYCVPGRSPYSGFPDPTHPRRLPHLPETRDAPSVSGGLASLRFRSDTLRAFCEPVLLSSAGSRRPGSSCQSQASGLSCWPRATKNSFVGASPAVPFGRCDWHGKADKQLGLVRRWTEVGALLWRGCVSTRGARRGRVSTPAFLERIAGFQMFMAGLEFEGVD